MGGPEGLMAKDIVPALGLRNALGQYPFINVETEDEKSIELARLLPTRHEILSFYHVYSTMAYPLCPLLIDKEGFETYLSDYLESITANNTPVNKLAKSQKGTARTALLLATLASGAQYSDKHAQERRKLSRDLARRSFHALRLANFLLRPLVESLQALLILGTTLQNDGNADAAWALLGTTTRLAQSLGLHSEEPVTEAQPDEQTPFRQGLWLTIAQQDCILSLCYDRPTALAYMPSLPAKTQASDQQPLTFRDAMWEISNIGLRLLATSFPLRANKESMLERLKEIDQFMLQTADHLQNLSHCQDLQQRAQFFLLSQHRSFAVTAICRPTFRKLQNMNGDTQVLDIQSIGKNALLQAVKSFLDLHTISVYPTRSWTCIHEALSSALLLTILGETRTSRETSLVQNKLIDVLLLRDQDDPGQAGNNALSSSHFKALRALQSLVRKASQEAPAQGLGSPQREPDVTEPAREDRRAPTGDTTAAVPDAGFDFFQSDLSPMAYLDSILWGSSKAQPDSHHIMLTELSDRSCQAEDADFLDFDFGD